MKNWYFITSRSSEQLDHFWRPRCIFFLFNLSFASVLVSTTRIAKGRMDNEMDEHEHKLRIALRLYACSEVKMKLSDAMKVTEYKTPERKGGSISACASCRTIDNEDND